MNMYEKRMGYRFDISHPVLFTEKIQWYKLFYKNSELKNIIDKYNFKAYIREHLGEGYTIPVLGVWSDIKSLEKDWEKFPEKFVLKSTISGFGNNIKIIKDKSKIHFRSLKKELKSWLNPLNTNLNSTATGYYDCTPRILAEEYMENIDEQLYDYKIFCFSGTPHYCYVVTDHFSNTPFKLSFYDLEWQKMEVRYGEHKNCEVEKPKHFDDMLSISRKLSKDFPFVRVDFFDLPEKLYLSEMTFYSGSGFIPYYPESFNREMGELFILPLGHNIT